MSKPGLMLQDISDCTHFSSSSLPVRTLLSIATATPRQHQHLSQLHVQLHFPGDPLPSRQPKVGIVIRIQLKMEWGYVYPSVAARRDKMPGYDQS